jgi:hypothetical protein
MVKIHGIVYLVLGAGIILASYRIDAQGLKLFIWAGYLFLAIGVFKLVFLFISRKKESGFEKKQVQMQMQRPVSQRMQQGRFCPRCGLNLKGYENFCARCGLQLRRMR